MTSEAQAHRSILAFLRLALPGAIIHHSANEVALSGKDVARAIGKAKSLGMLPGFPDIIILPFAHIGPLFFEVKGPKGRLSPSQADVLGRLDGLGYRCAVVRSIDDVQARLSEWGVWTAIKFAGKIS